MHEFDEEESRLALWYDSLWHRGSLSKSPAQESAAKSSMKPCLRSHAMSWS